MKRLMVATIVACSIGAGVFGAACIQAWSHISGRIEAQAVLFMETQEFKDAVAARHPFRMGDYWFVPGRDKVIVRKIRIQEVP